VRLLRKEIPRILPVFLLGATPEIMSKDETAQDAQTDEILKKYGICNRSKHLVRKDRDLLAINNHDADGYIVFPYTLERFASLILLAEIGKPVTIVSEEEAFLYALETYDYLSDHENVHIAFSSEEVKAATKRMIPAKWLESIKICVFDAGKWELDGIAWQKNPLFAGKLNAENIDMDKFLHACKNVEKTKAERIAAKWMKDAIVIEPSVQDIVKCAQIYLAMKATMKQTEADAAYVLWCGQFTKPLEAKLCFVLAKLAEEGHPVGCWRGGNLLPMLILNMASDRPVFTPEAFTHQGKTISLKHCFAPGIMGACKYTLRRWRRMKGTVTGYCQLPKGEVTIVNCGIGDKIVVAKGKIIDCKDLGAENCRITIWVRFEDEQPIHKFVGREFAVVYGDYEEEAKQIAEKLGIKVL
jgi:hypothetical protein